MTELNIKPITQKPDAVKTVVVSAEQILNELDAHYSKANNTSGEIRSDFSVLKGVVLEKYMSPKIDKRVDLLFGEPKFNETEIILRNWDLIKQSYKQADDLFKKIINEIDSE